MPATETLLLVAGAALLLWVLPGPALLLLLTRGIDLGPRGAVATAVGLSFGTAVHVLAAAVGLSAVLAASPTAFAAVKVLGGGYLVWLGFQRWRDATPLVPDALATPRVVRTDRQALAEGFTINALNPKVAVFFLAFLPPFVDVARGSILLQTVVLGMVVVVVLLTGDALFGLLSGVLGRRWLGRVLSPRRDRDARRVLAGVYVGLGLWAILGGDGTLGG